MLRRLAPLFALLVLLVPAVAPACTPDSVLEIENSSPTPQYVTVTGPCQISISFTVGSQAVTSLTLPEGSYTVTWSSGESPIDIARLAPERIII